MSRGHGQRQRSILARLAKHAGTAGPLADFEAEGEPFPSYLPVSVLVDAASRSALEATRRAVLRLEEEGRVHTLYVRKRRGRGRMQLCARLLSDETTEAEWRRRWEEHDAEFRRRRIAMRAAHGPK